MDFLIMAFLIYQCYGVIRHKNLFHFCQINIIFHEYIRKSIHFLYIRYSLNNFLMTLKYIFIFFY